MNSPLSAIYFGLLQGLTEFLPVSSSGHLLLFRSLFTPYDQPLLLDIVLHLGSLTAILLFFKKTIQKHFKNLTTPLIISIIPLGIAGLFFYPKIKFFFTTPQYLGLSFLITSLLLFIFPNLKQGKTKLTQITPSKALLSGLFQSLAIIPGISRSASTIFAGKLNKQNQSSTFQFAFLMAIPALLGSLALALKDGLPTLAKTNTNSIIAGFIASLLSSLIALKILQFILKKKNLSIFAWYTLALSAISFGLFG